MLTDEQASSWKKAMNSIQQNGKKEILTDEQASGWKKTMNSIQQNGERKCSRTNKLLTEESNELNSTERKKGIDLRQIHFKLKESNEVNSVGWKKGNAQERTSF